MIEHLRGVLQYKSPTFIVIETGGIGYKINLPLASYELLPAEGDEIKILPSGETTTVKTIEKFISQVDEAISGECIGITTKDPLFLNRGNVVCKADGAEEVTDTFDATIIWMTKKPFDKNEKITIRCATQETSAKIEKIKKRIDSSTLDVLEEDAAKLGNLEVGQVTIKTKVPIVVKSFNDVKELGRFVFVKNENICAGGIIT